MAMTNSTGQSEPSGYPPPQPATSAGRGFTIASFVFAALAVIIAPVFLGIAGIVLGVIGHTKRDPLAKWAIAASVVGMIVGIVLVAVVINAKN